ncbi:DUF92 domain-containing protein [Marinithermus hydrothermalis]|uniref:DUF92 domain-containing protein n=1 Tax=Marinithermus hydrothermalis (strain DSM 14884 / JCM 11576 / T1) TaxID=869210 RepID=F2NMZ3_MARHT|nr:DUF92 domain-containing protein [Marinithermus hydrothermalis]AEB12732.1 protein of unknown function DUF92 transmembrane [Marinithermus hydrothermalis DSM 14884]
MLLAWFALAYGVGLAAERLGWLRAGSAWAAGLVGGLVLYGGGLPAAFLLLAFVAVGHWASRRNPNSEDRRGRTAPQVLANGLPAALALALGSPAFFLGALGAALADTLATEVGRAAPWAWRPDRGRVPSGTNAAVSLHGTLALLAGSALLSLAAPFFATQSMAVFLGGVAGAVLDSLTGFYLEERVPWWGNNLNNTIATAFGGLVALALA